MGQFLEKPKVEKHNDRGRNEDIRYGLGSMQGWRVDMEDAHATVLKLDDQRWSQWSYFGIFDGHAGQRTAIRAADKLHHRLLYSLNQFLAEYAPTKTTGPVYSSHLDYHQFEMAIKDAYFKFDHEWRDENRSQNPEDRSGSTAISCLIDPERVYFLNVGDSRAILVSTEGRILLATKDHKPSDQAERQRIQEAGGTVLIQRVNGSLAVSRALGDFEYKNNSNRRPDQQLVSPEPDITSHPRQLTSDEHVAFIVLACDGIWDVITNEELAAYILGRMHVTDDLSEICNSILDMCLYKGSKDNMSIIIIAFKNAPQPTPECKAKDEMLDNEIRKKTIEIFNRSPNRTNADSTSIWQQVVATLNDQASIRDLLPIGGGIVSKRSVFESTFESLIKGTTHSGTSNHGDELFSSSFKNISISSSTVKNPDPPNGTTLTALTQ